MSLQAVLLVLAFSVGPLLALALRAYLARQRAAAMKDRARPADRRPTDQ